ncbi:6-bladed beta-propeller [Algoriphagus sp. Y33]|uniref:6-bladed beta-propeller n=1 Tax=Algoriphagus sp. Y33 TaxID=2772483 RepID=UPI00177A84E7|nr:6-bladed beta-propeller [Algoriphagus sp. Y33]
MHSIDIPDTDSELLIEDLAKSIKYIQLETTDGSYLTSIMEVKYSNGNLYVRDVSGKVLIFDSEGKFLNILGKLGDGPEEYSRAYSVAIDNSGLIYLGSQRKLQVYSNEHEFIKEKKFPFFIQYLSVEGSEPLVISKKSGIQVGTGYSSQTFVYSLNTSLDLIDSVLFRTEIHKKNTYSGFTTKNYISKNNNGLFLYTPVLISEKFIRDTLYKIDADSVVPIMKFNFEDPTMSSDDVKTIDLYNVMYSTSYLLCQYSRNKIPMLFIYNIDNGIGYNFKRGILNEQGNRLQLKPLDLANDIFYFIQEGVFFDSSSEELNPSIGIVELK